MTSPAEPNTPGGSAASGQNEPEAVATPTPGPTETGDTTPTRDTEHPNQPGTEKVAEQGRTFTQADVDRLINERIARERKTFEQQQADERKKLAAALGLADDEGEQVDPARALEDAQTAASKAHQRADRAEAKVLAAAAGINPKRVDAFVKLCGLSGALQGVDRSDEQAVTEAINAAVAQTVEEFPEFKGTTIPASSGGDRAGVQTPTVTVEQFREMDVSDRQKLYQDNPALYKQLREQARQ